MRILLVNHYLTCNPFVVSKMKDLPPLKIFTKERENHKFSTGDCPTFKVPPMDKVNMVGFLHFSQSSSIPGEHESVHGPEL